MSLWAPPPSRTPPAGEASAERLLPRRTGTAEEIVAGFGLDASPVGRGDWAPASASGPRRPHVMLNMVSTADGHATLDGRSGPLSGPADRALFHGLRLAVDAVMAGAATVRVERYGRIIPDASRRQTRVEQGRSEEPLACIVSGRLALEGDIPLLADPAARVVILTPSSASLPAGAAPPRSTTSAPRATGSSTCPRRSPSCASASACAPCCARAART